MWGKNIRAEQATDNDIIRGMLGKKKKGYKHTLSVRNIYCFSTETIVIRVS